MFMVVNQAIGGIYDIKKKKAAKKKRDRKAKKDKEENASKLSQQNSRSKVPLPRKVRVVREHGESPVVPLYNPGSD